MKFLGIFGGRFLYFFIVFFKVIELDEGDKFYLDCIVEGWFRSLCKFCNNLFLELFNGIDKLIEIESFVCIEYIDFYFYFVNYFVFFITYF